MIFWAISRHNEKDGVQQYLMYVGKNGPVFYHDRADAMLFTSFNNARCQLEVLDSLDFWISSVQLEIKMEWVK